MNGSSEFDAMATMPNQLDDLDNLFEFGDIDLNNITEDGEFGGHMQEQHNTHPNTPFQDLGMNKTSAPATHDFGSSEQYGLSPATNPYSTDGMYQTSTQPLYNMHAQNYQLNSQQGYQQHQIVPPTPNSFEMHGETGHFMHQQQQLDPQQRAILDQRYGLRKDDAMAFTPMVSPAGTPQFNNILPEYTTPGAYFSPLTSPMIHAQHAGLQHQQGYLPNSSTAPNSHTNSPVDLNLDIDMLGENISLPHSAGPQPRKSRRKIATPKSIGATRGQTTATKSQKRKSSSTVPTSHAGDLNLRAVQSQPASTDLQAPTQPESSEAESISPEALSESVMGPPPRPGSSMTISPALLGQKKSATQPATPAATPKSLLNTRSHQQPIQESSQSPAQVSQGLGGLDDLSLPEAATKPPPTANGSASTTTDENAPRLRKTPKLGPLSTPNSARPQSATQSPSAGSPMTASTPSAILQSKERHSKKRGTSISGGAAGSKMASPALQPKISPSIKPLLPEGTPLNSATQAILLASKSNYQNLLEGNKLPGVNYPDSLQSGLTSKRTSHKVAEQGRRNRINDALKEMQALIPGKVDGEEDAGVGSAGSKAATVELANEYIRRMQAEQADLRREVEGLRRKLGEEASSSSPNE